jgi:prevent-host-death family protein
MIELEVRRFGELVDACLADGPQVVHRNGAAVALLVPADAWRRLHAQAAAQRSTLTRHRPPSHPIGRPIA